MTKKKRTTVLLLSIHRLCRPLLHVYVMRSLLFCVLVGLLIRDYISLIWVVFTHEIPRRSTPLLMPHSPRCCHQTVNLLSIRFLLVSFKHAWSVNQSIFFRGTKMTSIWHPLTATHVLGATYEFYSSTCNTPEAIPSTDYRIYSIYAVPKMMRDDFNLWKFFRLESNKWKLYTPRIWIGFLSLSICSRFPMHFHWTTNSISIENFNQNFNERNNSQDQSVRMWGKPLYRNS